MSGADRQIETQEIVCSNGMPAFLARPAAPGRYPVVVLIHERYGLVPHTRDLAKKCASDGFFVVAANYFFKHPDQKALNAGDGRYPITDAESIKEYCGPGDPDIGVFREFVNARNASADGSESGASTSGPKSNYVSLGK